MINRTLTLSDKRSVFLVHTTARFLGAALHDGKIIVMAQHADDAPNVLEHREVWNLGRHPEPERGLQFISSVETDIGVRHVYWTCVEGADA
jgi:hypothetical protein